LIGWLVDWLIGWNVGSVGRLERLNAITLGKKNEEENFISQVLSFLRKKGHP